MPPEGTVMHVSLVLYSQSAAKHMDYGPVMNVLSSKECEPRTIIPIL